MIYALTDELAVVWIELIQRWFATNPEAQEYRWTADDSSSRLMIADQVPDTARRWPCIIVRAIPGDSIEASLSQSAGPEYSISEPQVEIGERFVGWFQPRMEFVVEAQSDKDSKRVMDILFAGLVRTLRIEVEKETSGRVKIDPPAIRVSGGGARLVADKLQVFSRTVSLQCRVEWQEVVLYENTLTDVAPTVTVQDY